MLAAHQPHAAGHDRPESRLTCGATVPAAALWAALSHRRIICRPRAARAKPGQCRRRSMRRPSSGAARLFATGAREQACACWSLRVAASAGHAVQAPGVLCQTLKQSSRGSPASRVASCEPGRRVGRCFSAELLHYVSKLRVLRNTAATRKRARSTDNDLDRCAAPCH